MLADNVMLNAKPNCLLIFTCREKIEEEKIVIEK